MSNLMCVSGGFLRSQSGICITLHANTHGYTQTHICAYKDTHKIHTYGYTQICTDISTHKVHMYVQGVYVCTHKHTYTQGEEYIRSYTIRVYIQQVHNCNNY